MADLYSINGRAELAGGNPLTGWVYTSHYKLFQATASADPSTQAEYNNVGHSFQRAVAPNWSTVGSSLATVINMMVDSNRWDAATLKQVMDEQVYRSTAGDTTWTITEATGAWIDGSALAWHDSDSGDKIKGTYSWFTEARFPENAGDRVDDTEEFFVPYSVITQDQTDLDAGDQEYANAIETGMTFNLGNHFDGTGRTINYPGDLAISPDRLYLLAIEGDDFGDTDIDQTTDAFYDINGDYEKIISEFNPLAYTWVKKNEAALDNSQQLLMFFDAKQSAPVDVLTRLNGLGSWAGSGTNDVYIYMGSPDFVWSGSDSD